MKKGLVTTLLVAALSVGSVGISGCTLPVKVEQTEVSQYKIKISQARLYAASIEDLAYNLLLRDRISVGDAKVLHEKMEKIYLAIDTVDLTVDAAELNQIQEQLRLLKLDLKARQ